MKLEVNIKEVEIPEIPEPSESDTKKRRVESSDESVDWFQKGRPMLGLQILTNVKSLKLTRASSGT